MEVNARTCFTPKQKAELWERWRSGQCVADIARALARRNKSGVYRVLALHGGIAPTPRRSASAALRLEEREEISRGIAAGWSMRRIAQGLGRSLSTVSREIRRNGGCSAYRASEADTRAWERALRPKPCRLARHAELRWRVAQKLALQWSPEQILWLAEAAIPCRPRHAGIARNDLSESLYSDTRRAEEGADGAPADSAADALSQGRQHEERAGTARRYGLHPRAAGRSQGPRGARPLGRRPSLWSQQHAQRRLPHSSRPVATSHTTCRAPKALNRSPDRLGNSD